MTAPPRRAEGDCIPSHNRRPASRSAAAAARWTAHSETRASQDRNQPRRGAGGPTLTGAGRGGRCSVGRGEDKGLYDVVKQDPEPPWTETDRPGPDMGRPAGWHPAGVHTAKHGQVTLHGTLHVSCEVGEG